MDVKAIKMPKLGWGFLLTWVFCSFYATDGIPSLVHSASEVHSAFLSIAMSITPVLSAVVTLIVLVLIEPRAGSIVDVPYANVVSALMTSAGTLLMFVMPAGDSATLRYLIGSLLAGVGSGAMWILWGEYYSRIPQDDVETLAPASILLAGMFVLLASAIHGWIGVCFVASMPICAAVCFVGVKEPFATQGKGVSQRFAETDRARVKHAHDHVLAHPTQALSSMKKSGWGIFVACCFTSIAGAISSVRLSGATFQFAAIASLVLLVVVGLISTRGPRRLTIAFMYRWMCPVLVLAFVCIIVFPNDFGNTCASGISLMARFSFCLIVQVFFANFAARGQATPTQAYGFGWIFAHLGDLVGVSITIALSTFAPNASLVTISAVCVFLLVSATMTVMNADEAFAAVSGQSGKTSTPHEGPGDRFDRFQGNLDRLARQFDLTPRETEIFDLLMRGRSVPFIRDELMISRDTVATHVRHIYAKANVHSRQELLDLAESSN